MNSLPNEIMAMILSYARPSFWMLKYQDLEGVDKCIYISGQTQENILEFLWKNRHLGWMQNARRSVEPVFLDTFNLDLQDDFDKVFGNMIHKLNVNFA